MLFFDILGWIGAVTVLASYALLSTGVINNGKIYQTLNLLSAVFLGVGLLPKDAWFSFALQVAWGTIAIIGLIKIASTKSTAKHRRAHKKRTHKK